MDLSPGNLPPGREIEIADVPHNGCAAFTRRYGRDAGVFVNTGEGRRLCLRGIYGGVVKDGLVSVGDKVVKLGSRSEIRAREQAACG